MKSFVFKSSDILLLICVFVCVCAVEMEGERQAAAAVVSVIHCWECYNLDYISCSLKVYFPINSNLQLIKINSASA